MSHNACDLFCTSSESLNLYMSNVQRHLKRAIQHHNGLLHVCQIVQQCLFSSDTLVLHILKSSAMLLQKVSLKFSICLMGPSVCVSYFWIMQRHRQRYTAFQVISYFFMPCQVLCTPCGCNCTFTNERYIFLASHAKPTINRPNSCQSTQRKTLCQSQSKAWISTSKSLWMFVCLWLMPTCICVVWQFFTIFHMLHMSVILMVMWTLCCLAVLSQCAAIESPTSKPSQYENSHQPARKHTSKFIWKVTK